MKRAEFSSFNHTQPEQNNSCRSRGASNNHHHQYTSQNQAARPNLHTCHVTHHCHGNSLSSTNHHVTASSSVHPCTCHNQDRVTANGKPKPHQKENIFYKFLKCLQGSAQYRKLMTQRANIYGVNTVSKIDKVSRVLFPLSFIILNIIYWTAYTK